MVFVKHCKYFQIGYAKSLTLKALGGGYFLTAYSHSLTIMDWCPKYVVHVSQRVMAIITLQKIPVTVSVKNYDN